MSERASQFFFTVLGFQLLLFYKMIIIFGKTKLGREFVTVHFAPLRDDVCHRFWLKLLGV